jgi:parallel beta-helix repeat protein
MPPPGNNLKTYDYTVGLKTGLKTIQQAIDRIAIELQGTPAPAKDITIAVDKGIYPGFSIPRGMLIPLLASGFQLIIRPQGNFFPIIDGMFSAKNVHVGADIDAANPNVLLTGLRFQNFSVGVRATLNSHNVIVKDCLVSDNTNVGILIEQCSNTILVNNIVANGDFGIVARLCNNAALLHNTVLLNGTVGEGQAAIWAQLANDYGGGQTDTGQLHLIGNIAWNMTTNPTLILFQEDLESGSVVSNFNDFVRTGDSLIGIEKKNSLPTSSRERRDVFGLKEWKGLGFTNPNGAPLDASSISQDPKFLQPIKGRKRQNGLYIDLSLLPISPVLGIVPSLYFDTQQAAVWLPSYVDAVELLSKDILQNTRITTGTAAGANEKRSNSGYFGQDVFLSPRNLDPNKDCDVDPINDLIFKQLDLWFPRLKVGFFSSHEREYYLYAKKHSRFLGECAATEFRLPARLLPERPIKVSVAGDNIRDPRYIDLRGDSVVLYHFDLDIQDGTEEFEIQGWIRKWNKVDLAFSYFSTHYRFKINEGRTRFLIPPDYKSNGPVVVTDDASSMSDPDELANREYTVKWDADEQRAEILFANNSNMFLNAQFDSLYGEAGANPRSWSAVGANVESGQFYSGFQTVMGDNACRLEPGGSIRQMMPMTSGNWALSWHSLVTEIDSYETTTSSSPDLYYNAVLYDANYDSIGVTFEGSFAATGGWTRNYVTFGTPDPNSHVVPEIVHPVSGLGNHPDVQEIAAFADVSIHNDTSTVDLWLDALQYEEAIRPSMYHRRARFQEMTVEYETDDGEEFVDFRQAIAPVRNKMSQGFLHIPEIPASMYNGPRGGIVTTLYDVRWPEGRSEVIPWARLTGKDKLRHKQIFNTVPEKSKPVIEPVHVTFLPVDVSVNPDEVIARQDDKTGEGLEILCVNEAGNPYSLGVFLAKIKEPLGRFSGWLHKKFLGANEILSSKVIGKLDSAGSAHLLWIPPEGKSVAYVGNAPPSPAGNLGDLISGIEVNYRVNGDYHGNIIVLDDEMNKMDVVATSTNTNTYEPSYAKNFSIIQVAYPPDPGSVKVSVDGKFLIETFVDSPNSDQFFVNYTNSQIILRGRVEQATVEYLPTYAFTNPGMIDLEVDVYYPDGDRTITNTVPLIAQNHLVSQHRHVNVMSAEY